MGQKSGCDEMCMTINVESLSRLPLFARLDAEALRQILPHIHEQSLEPGQVAVWEGEPCTAVYFVLNGLVRTRRMSLNGREHVLAYLGPGECFNLVPALDGGRNPVTVDAVAPTRLCRVACTECGQILADHFELTHAVLEHLAREVRRLDNMVELLALHSVRSRLARFLLDYAEGRAPARQWTQEEIATHIGTVREMVSRTMRDLALDGLIRRERGRIVVLDRAALEREAAGE
jgi:CRP/FNR family cyclic AMP-dependent transcriptional regulator